MAPKIDISIAVRFVDDYMDKDPKTRDSCPGKVNKHKLVLIGQQRERRIIKLLLNKKIKHYIFREEGTRNIWYKNSVCNPGVVMMGFSLSLLKMHPNAVPMEKYAKYFIDNIDAEWLAQNDFVLQ